MTAVFVHGVPETADVWDALIAELGRADTVQLSLPGFGCDLPAGFTPDMETYASWLAAELAAFDEVDLVVHDWGSLLAVRVLADRPANIRSWVSDRGDLGPDFEWHDTAKVWQTPGDGEAMIDGFVGASTEDRAALLGAVGVPDWFAPTMAAGFDARMGACILTLYRSAVDVGRAWGPLVDRIAGPGLAIDAAHDGFRAPGAAARLAARIGCEVLELPDSGHFWMLDAPEVVAPAITAFWAAQG